MSYTWTCQRCEQTSDPFPTVAERDQMKGIHDPLCPGPPKNPTPDNKPLHTATFGVRIRRQKV